MELHATLAKVGSDGKKDVLSLELTGSFADRTGDMQEAMSLRGHAVIVTIEPAQTAIPTEDHDAVTCEGQESLETVLVADDVEDDEGAVPFEPVEGEEPAEDDAGPLGEVAAEAELVVDEPVAEASDLSDGPATLAEALEAEGKVMMDVTGSGKEIPVDPHLAEILSKAGKGKSQAGKAASADE